LSSARGEEHQNLCPPQLPLLLPWLLWLLLLQNQRCCCFPAPFPAHPHCPCDCGHDGRDHGGGDHGRGDHGRGRGDPHSSHRRAHGEEAQRALGRWGRQLQRWGQIAAHRMLVVQAPCWHTVLVAGSHPESEPALVWCTPGMESHSLCPQLSNAHSSSQRRRCHAGMCACATTAHQPTSSSSFGSVITQIQQAAVLMMVLCLILGGAPLLNGAWQQ
jgi:hypothetical protein